MGIQPNIHQALVMFPIVNYTNMVMRSLVIEAKEVELNRDREASAPAKNV